MAHLHFDRRPSSRLALHHKLATKPCGPLFHTLQTEATPLLDRYRIEPDSIVGNFQDHHLIDLLQAHQNMLGMSMPENVI